MKAWGLLVVVAACGGEPSMSCDEMSRLVIQRRGACRVSGLSDFESPLGAHCGERVSCPAGESLACDDQDTNCHYGDVSSFNPIDADTNEWLIVQRLDGVDGLIVQKFGTEACRFVTCEP